jgi:hypothetical protein
MEINAPSGRAFRMRKEVTCSAASEVHARGTLTGCEPSPGAQPNLLLCSA